jgi:hypothetical protein
MLIWRHLIGDLQTNLNVKQIFPLAASILNAAQLMAQSAAPATFIKADRLLNPRSANVL